MTLEQALPTFGCVNELQGFVDAAKAAGDKFTKEQLGAIARRKIELQKGNIK